MEKLKSNKLTIFRLIFLYITTTLFTGCYSHSYYLNNSHNVPVFKHKDESHIAFGASTDSNIESFNFETAYSVTNNLAFMLNYMSNKNLGITEFGQTGNYYDFAIGYYKPFGRFSNLNNPFIWDIYLGYGHQKQNHLYGNSEGVTGTSDLCFHKPFIQSSLGITSYTIDLIFSTRIAYANYYSIETNGDLKYYLETIEMVKNQRNFLLFEPAMTFRFGWKYIKFQNQISQSYNLHNDILTPSINFSIGAVFTLTNRYLD